MIQLSTLFFRPKSRSFLTLVLGGVFLFTAACAPLFSPGEPPAYIQFMAKFESMNSGNAKTKKMQLSVAAPTAPAELNGDSIILLLKNREFRRLEGYRWVSSVPELMQRSIIAGLESSRAFASVSPAGAGIRPHARLLCDIDEFAFGYAEEKSLPNATVAVTFRLVDFTSGNVLGTLPILKTANVQSNEIEHMATAAEKLTSDIVRELNDWIVTIY